MNALSNENLTISSDTTLNPAAEDEDILNVVLVPVLVMTLMISIAAIVMQFIHFLILLAWTL